MRIINKQCKCCGKDFQCSITNTRQIYCSKNCRWKVKHQNQHKISVLKTADSETFGNDKEKYLDKIIPYADSPTGKAYIGLAKAPLMPNDNGIGFKGVKLQNEDRSLIQCSECGRWLKRINYQHIKTCFKGSVADYKKKFGFKVRTGLLSDTENRKQSKIVIHSAVPTGKYKNNLRKFKQKPFRTFESMNNRGTCPEQLKARLVEFINSTHRYPRGNTQGCSTGMYTHRFGSFNAALAAYGLPTRKKLGHLTEYLFADKTIFYTKSGMGYEELYEIMLEKCPVLSQYNI